LEFYRQYFIKTSGGVDLFENKKAVIKVMENIEKQRKILSANSEQSLNMEYLIEDHDLLYTMKREEFEKLAEPVLSRLFVALQKHKIDLEGANIKLNSIELVGGGTRIPAFIRLIQSLFKMEPTRTINSNEAIAKGCAIMATWKNPAFRPAEVTLEEINYNPIVAHWNSGRNITFAGSLTYINPQTFPQHNQTILFPSGCPVPSVHELKINGS
jgi:heat shock protein 4